MPECVEPFANLGIPTLSEVLDPVKLGKYLRVFSSLPWQWGALQSIEVRTLRCRNGSRCTVEINLRFSTGQHALIGKVYAKDRSDIYRAMEGIRQAGFGPLQEFSIPQPLTFLPALRLLIQEKVPGPLATTAFLTGRERDGFLAAERCARWLARFHAVAPKAGRIWDLNRHVSYMERWSQQIAELGEPFAGRAARLSQLLEVAASSTGRAELRAGHGDYEHTQVIFAKDRTVTFDWDRYDVADPARDVARFIVALRRLALGRLGSIGALDGVAEVFLKTYVASSRSEVAPRLPFYKGAICVEIARHAAYKQAPQCQERVQAMLDEGLRVLEQEASR